MNKGDLDMVITSNTSTITVTSIPPDGNLIFSDDFDGSTLDPNKWTKPSGTWIWPWTDADSNNISVSNGMVRMKISTSTIGKPYRGCMLDTFAGQPDKQTYTLTYGKCEVRARLPPSNNGITAYILLWPEDNIWPPEIDFVECDGRTANTLFFTQHYCSYTGNQNDYCRIRGYKRIAPYYPLSNIDITQWHIYSVELTSSSVKWYVDGQLKVTQANYNPGQKWLFGAGIWAGCCGSGGYCATGEKDKWGGWGGCPTGHPFPQYMDIDYVRIWKY